MESHEQMEPLEFMEPVGSVFWRRVECDESVGMEYYGWWFWKYLFRK